LVENIIFAISPSPVSFEVYALGVPVRLRKRKLVSKKLECLGYPTMRTACSYGY